VKSGHGASNDSYEGGLPYNCRLVGGIEDSDYLMKWGSLRAQGLIKATVEGLEISCTMSAISPFSRSRTAIMPCPTVTGLHCQHSY
jgi:hypothetical protein